MNGVWFGWLISLVWVIIWLSENLRNWKEENWKEYRNELVMAYYYWSSEIPKSDCKKIIKEFSVSTSKEAATGNFQGVDSLYSEEIEYAKKHDMECAYNTW